MVKPVTHGAQSLLHPGVHILHLGPQRSVCALALLRLRRKTGRDSTHLVSACLILQQRICLGLGVIVAHIWGRTLRSFRAGLALRADQRSKPLGLAAAEALSDGDLVGACALLAGDDGRRGALAALGSAVSRADDAHPGTVARHPRYILAPTQLSGDDVIHRLCQHSVRRREGLPVLTLTLGCVARAVAVLVALDNRAVSRRGDISVADHPPIDVVGKGGLQAVEVAHLPGGVRPRPTEEQNAHPARQVLFRGSLLQRDINGRAYAWPDVLALALRDDLREQRVISIAGAGKLSHLRRQYEWS